MGVCYMGRKKIRIEKECLYCGKKFEVRPCEIKKGGKYCSRSCACTYRNLHNNPAWDENVRKKISQNHADVSGENNPMYGKRGNLAPSYIDGRNSFIGEVYRKILLASGKPCVCKLCGKTHGKIDVHHLDGNRSNNSLSNLIFLCRKCHISKAHTYLRDDTGKIIGSKLNKLNF